MHPRLAYVLVGRGRRGSIGFFFKNLKKFKKNFIWSRPFPPSRSPLNSSVGRDDLIDMSATRRVLFFPPCPPDPG